MNTILFIIAVVGVTNIINNEVIFGWFRTWVDNCLPDWCYDLVTCPTCLSVWVCVATMFFFPFTWIEFVTLPFVCSIVSKITASLIQF